MKESRVLHNTSIIGILVVVLSAVSWHEGQSAEEPHLPATRGTFAQFLGVNGGPGGPPLQASDKELWQSLSYVRAPITWEELQPKGPAEWKQAVLQEYGKGVLENHAKGVRVLPVLCYSTTWAARKDAWSYAESGNRYDVSAFDGRPDRRAVKITRLASGKSSPAEWSTRVMCPKDAADWEKYVDRVVGFLSGPPYHVEYFQIWNEASDMLWNGQFSGFWYGGMDAYMRTIHLPAARIVKKYGAKVVYGGYPDNGSLADLVSLLDRHHAWNTLDVLDVHYLGVSHWQYLYDKAKDQPRKLGIWQTEVGFTTSPAWVPNNFPRFFHWELTHGWQPDRYKLFQFAYWSPDDPKAFGYDCCFLAGGRYTCHGKALVTLGRLLSGPVVKAYDDWESTPALRAQGEGSRAGIEGFRCGDRIVLAVHVAPSTTELAVRFPGLRVPKVSTAFRIGVYGSKTPLTALPAESGKNAGAVQLRVPVRDAAEDEEQANRQSPIRTFYVVLELAP